MPISVIPNPALEQQNQQQNIFMQLMSNMVLQKMAQGMKEKELALQAQQVENQQKHWENTTNAGLFAAGATMDQPMRRVKDAEGKETMEPDTSVRTVDIGGKKWYMPEGMQAQPITYNGVPLGMAIRTPKGVEIIKMPDGSQMTPDKLGGEWIQAKEQRLIQGGMDPVTARENVISQYSNMTKLPGALPGSFYDPNTGTYQPTYLQRTPQGPQPTTAPIGQGGVYQPPGMTSQPSASTVETTGQQYNALDILRRQRELTVKIGPEKFGRFQGFATKGQSWLKGAEYDPDVMEFTNLKEQQHLSAQSAVKGIPSNYDVQTLVKTFADFNMPYSTALNKIDTAERLTRELYKNSVAYWKSQSKALPPNVVEQARSVGIDPDTVAPWDGKGDPINRGAVPKLTNQMKAGGSSASGVKVGTKRVVKGTTYEWDGELWQPR